LCRGGSLCRRPFDRLHRFKVVFLDVAGYGAVVSAGTLAIAILVIGFVRNLSTMISERWDLYDLNDDCAQ
jgi:hypothetical protein